MVDEEGDGVVNPFSTKQAAIDYATRRLAFGWGEVRIHGESGTLERTIAFNDRDH